MAVRTGRSSIIGMVMAYKPCMLINTCCPTEIMATCLNATMAVYICLATTVQTGLIKPMEYKSARCIDSVFRKQIRMISSRACKTTDQNCIQDQIGMMSGAAMAWNVLLITQMSIFNMLLFTMAK